MKWCPLSGCKPIRNKTVASWSTCNAAGDSESSGVKVLTLAKKVTSLQVKVPGFSFTLLLPESK